MHYHLLGCILSCSALLDSHHTGLPWLWDSKLLYFVILACLLEFADTSDFFFLMRMQLITAIGMGPVLALKYFRYTYRSSAINLLQQAERSRTPFFSIGNLESQLKSTQKDAESLSPQPKSRSAVYEPLLTDSPTAVRRSIGSSTQDFFQPSQSRLSSYARNYKSKWVLWWLQGPFFCHTHNLLLIQMI